MAATFGVSWMDIMLFAGLLLVTMLYSKEKKKTQIVRNFFGPEFLKALVARDGILFLRFDSSGDSDFHFVPWTNKDETFYYIELPRGDGKEKEYYKVRKKDLFRLRNRLNLAIVVEDSIAAVPPKVMQVFSNLSPGEKARFLNAYMEYHSLKNQREYILQRLRFEALEKKPDEVESLKEQLNNINREMEEIKEKWSAIIQEVDLDGVIVLEDKKDKKLLILRPIQLDEISDYLEATRPDEIIYTAKKIFLDWQQIALESLKKLVNPVKNTKSSKGSMLTTILLMGGLVFIVLMLMGRTFL